MTSQRDKASPAAGGKKRVEVPNTQNVYEHGLKVAMLQFHEHMQIWHMPPSYIIFLVLY